MKKILLLAAMILAATAASAQRELNPLNTHSGHDCEPRVVIRGGLGDYLRGDMTRNYQNVGYVFQTSFDRAFNDGPPLTANTKKGWGMSVTYGTSYILHRQPVLGRLHFGLDATWIDANYVKGQTIRLNGGKGRTHQLDLAMGVGPAVHIDAGGDWTVEAHLRYNPTLATYYNEAESWHDARWGYASMWTGGGSASWRRWSLGAEVRFGRGTYRTLDWDKYVVPNQGGPPRGTTDDRVMKLRTIGVRVTLGLRW